MPMQSFVPIPPEFSPLQHTHCLNGLTFRCFTEIIHLSSRKNLSQRLTVVPEIIPFVNSSLQLRYCKGVRCNVLSREGD